MHTTDRLLFFTICQLSKETVSGQPYSHTFPTHIIHAGNPLNWTSIIKYLKESQVGTDCPGSLQCTWAKLKHGYKMFLINIIVHQLFIH